MTTYFQVRRRFFRPSLDPAVVDRALFGSSRDEAPPTVRRPELANEWAHRMVTWPEVRLGVPEGSRT